MMFWLHLKFDSCQHLSNNTNITQLSYLSNCFLEHKNRSLSWKFFISKRIQRLNPTFSRRYGDLATSPTTRYVPKTTKKKATNHRSNLHPLNLSLTWFSSLSIRHRSEPGVLRRPTGLPPTAGTSLWRRQLSPTGRLPSATWRLPAAARQLSWRLSRRSPSGLHPDTARLRRRRWRPLQQPTSRWRSPLLESFWFVLYCFNRVMKWGFQFVPIAWIVFWCFCYL